MFGKQELLSFLKKMLLIRSFETNLDKLFAEGKVHGTCHLSIGQEAVAVGICSQLKKNDYVTSTHRGHGHALAKGLDPKKLLLEFLGKEQGYSSGRGGTQHTLSMKDHFFGNGITGGMVPVACGLAYAQKYRGQKNIVVSFFGDGAINEGYVTEALNLAAVWQLPIVFVCENNWYAMSTPIKESTRSKKLADRASSLGIKSYTLDGNDVVALAAWFKNIRKQLSKKSEPIFLECLTYRQCGHSKNDLRLYRTKREEQAWIKKDPISKLKNYLLRNKIIDENRYQKLRQQINAQIQTEARSALIASEPTVNSLDDYHA